MQNWALWHLDWWVRRVLNSENKRSLLTRIFALSSFSPFLVPRSSRRPSLCLSFSFHIHSPACLSHREKWFSALGFTFSGTRNLEITVSYYVQRHWVETWTWRGCWEKCPQEGRASSLLAILVFSLDLLFYPPYDGRDKVTWVDFYMCEGTADSNLSFLHFHFICVPLPPHIKYIPWNAWNFSKYIYIR